MRSILKLHFVITAVTVTTVVLIILAFNWNVKLQHQPLYTPHAIVQKNDSQPNDTYCKPSPLNETIHCGNTHIQQLAARLRTYASLLAYLEQCPAAVSATTDDNRALVNKFYDLEQQLFPFLTNKSSLGWRKSFRPGRGLVVCVNRKYLRFTLSLIDNLRLLGSSLPVEVFYKTGELNAAHIALLEQRGAKPVDIYMLLDQQLSAMSHERFSIKPFALFLSSYSETMLVDADTVFFQKPDKLFDNDGYKQTGTLMFLDRYYSHRGKVGMGPSWFEANMPKPISDRLKSSQIYRGKSNYFVEAGVVLMDKTRNLVEALTACRLMSKHERSSWFGDGDKEAFWFGFELLGKDFAIHSSRPGVIGWLAPNPQTHVLEVCGNLLHPGDDGRPFWLNGGIVLKHENNDKPIKHEAFAVEGDSDTLRIGDVCCLEEKPPIHLQPSELSTIAALEKFWNATIIP